MKKVLPFVIACMFMMSSCKSLNKVPNVPQINTGNDTKPPASDTAPPAKYNLADFFPLYKDVHILYKGLGNEFAGYESYVDYVKGNTLQMRQINGTVSVVVYQISNGELKKVYTRGETYYHYDYTAAKNYDEILIKEPISVGTQWTLKDGSKRSITALDKNVETSLGKYKALEITTISPDSKVVEYYAKDVGFIKRVFTPNNSSDQITAEIQKIDKNVPYKHQVKFYFPDFDNNRIVYVNRDVEINTNQDMKYKFQKELKTVPEGSKLTKVLTPKVTVNGMVLDEKNGSVTVDFSKELIKDMNAGSGLEGLILKSIASTFGDYYNVRKVSITIEGKPYSSGHFIIDKGQYINVDTSNIEEFKK